MNERMIEVGKISAKVLLSYKSAVRGRKVLETHQR